MYITTKVKICHIFLHSLTLTEFYAHDPISFFKTKIVNIVYVYLKIVYSSKMSQRVSRLDNLKLYFLHYIQAENLYLIIANIGSTSLKGVEQQKVFLRLFDVSFFLS